jgi:hypothetical protein
MSPPKKFDAQKTRFSPGFPSADYLPPVLFSSGLGVSFAGCGAAGGVITSGFGVSAAAVTGLVMEMTFHIQTEKIFSQEYSYSNE